METNQLTRVAEVKRLDKLAPHRFGSPKAGGVPLTGGSLSVHFECP